MWHGEESESPDVEFIGGPLDGYTFTVEQVNRVGFIVYWDRPAAGKPSVSFVRMPPMAVCDVIFRGHVRKDQAFSMMRDGWDRWAVYERVWLAEGVSEFREAAARYAEVVPS